MLLYILIFVVKTIKSIMNVFFIKMVFFFNANFGQNITMATRMGQRQLVSVLAGGGKFLKEGSRRRGSCDG